MTHLRPPHDHPGFDACVRCHPTNCCYTQDVFELVDRHFAARTAITSIDAQLDQQEVAFRSIQKRLLVRYKVRTAFAVCLRVQRRWERTRRRAQPNQCSNLQKASADGQSACSSPAGSQDQLALFKKSCVAACLPRVCVCAQDKNAGPLNRLDVLMEEVYEHILELADKVWGGVCAGVGFEEGGIDGHVRGMGVQ